MTDLATHMPQFSASIRSKLVALHKTRNGSLARIQQSVEQAGENLDKQEGENGSPTTSSPADRKDVQPVQLVPTPPTDAEWLRAAWKPVAKPVGTAGIVLILVIFMLAQREDLRNRLIRLAGRGRLTVTTRTLDEATRQISRFLFSQTLINAAFGLFVAVGLLLIGIPYALLWGVTAAILRFVPYLGTTLAMLLVAGLAFVGSEGWAPTVETLVLFCGAGLVAYVLDPIVNGTRTGTSSFALLVSAIFWTWLWGPIGLLLSTPIAVCLVAIGKHVPEMEFLTVLLSDEPALNAADSFYQRLLAGDEDEAGEILEQQSDKTARDVVFDRVVVPALLLAERDRLRGAISDAEQERVMRATLDILRNRDAAGRHEQPGSSHRVRRVLGVPARSAADGLALEMVGQLLGSAGALVRLSPVMLASEVFDAIEETQPDLMCIAALAPGGVNHTRYLCRQVHGRFPDLPIWVLRIGAQAAPLTITRQLLADGAQYVAVDFVAAAAEVERSLLGDTEPGHTDHTDNHPDIERAGLVAVGR